MPAQPIRALRNSPIQFYNFPNQYYSEAFNQYIQDCGVAEQCFCAPVRPDDPLCFQFKAEETGPELIKPFFTPIRNGTNTAVSSYELVDSGGAFTTTPAVGTAYTVVNISDMLTSYAVAPITATTVPLNDDIFTATPQDYQIFPFLNNGAWQYNPTTNLLIMPQAAFGEVIFPALTVGNWYRAVFTVQDYIGGELIIRMGSTVVGTVAGNGTYTFYGKCATVGYIQFDANGTFSGSIDTLSIEVYELNQLYFMSIIDQNDNTAYSELINYDGEGLNTGNIIVCGKEQTWGEYLCDCSGELISSTTFEDKDAWVLNGVTADGELVFNDANTEANAKQIVACDLSPETQYSITFEITSHTTGGVYIILDGETSGSYSSVGIHTVVLTTGPDPVVGEIGIVASTDPTTLTISNITMHSVVDVPCDGCYTIRIAGNANCQLIDLITDPRFTNPEEWQTEGGATVGGGSSGLHFDATDSGAYARQKLLCNLLPNTEYTFTFIIANRTDGGVYFDIGGFVTGSYSADGEYSITFTTGVNPTDDFSIVASSTPTSLDIIFVSITTEDYVYDLYSECYCLGEWPCTLLLKWQNREGNHVFGYNYADPSYYNYFRVHADLMPASPRDLTYNWQKGSTGQAEISYANLLKPKRFVAEEMPEWAHNAIAVGLKHERLFVEDVQYISIGGYEPNWEQRRLKAIVETEIAQSDQTDLVNTI